MLSSIHHNHMLLDVMMGICVELLIRMTLNPHPAITMSCSDTDPYCVSYPSVVSQLQQILVGIAAESIAYGIHNL